jgi:hypothetical protein
MAKPRKEGTEPVRKITPLKVIRIDDVSASIFDRKVMVRGEEQTFYSISFTRSYRDSSGKWNYVKSFGLDDLGKLVTVAQQSDVFIRDRLKEDEAA